MRTFGVMFSLERCPYACVSSPPTNLRMPSRSDENSHYCGILLMSYILLCLLLSSLFAHGFPLSSTPGERRMTVCSAARRALARLFHVSFCSLVSRHVLFSLKVSFVSSWLFLFMFVQGFFLI